MDLGHETDRLRFEFLDAELNLSLTFARLARGKFLTDPKHSDHLTEEELQGLSERADRLSEEIESVRGRPRAA